MTTRSISKFATTLFAAILCVFPIPTPAHAQTGLTYGLPSARVTVPFAFECGSRHLEAGTYEIKPVTNHIISLHKAYSGDSGTMLMVMQDDSSRIPTKSKVVFHQYGGTYFLSEVWQGGHAGYAHAPLTKAEKQLRTAVVNNVAANSPSGLVDTVIAVFAQ